MTKSPICRVRPYFGSSFSVLNLLFLAKTSGFSGHFGPGLAGFGPSHDKKILLGSGQISMQFCMSRNLLFLAKTSWLLAQFGRAGLLYLKFQIYIAQNPPKKIKIGLGPIMGLKPTTSWTGSSKRAKLKMIMST